MSFDIKKLEKFPTQPGVYLMRGNDAVVLYVGKAKNLRQRVKQYFIEGRDGRLMVPFLVSKVHEIDTIVVTSEKEALLLENNLIKQHQPRYNALLKDDKTYVALKINVEHEWPMVSLIRYKGKPKNDGLYFGPYLSAEAARKTLDFLHKVFPLRQCSDQELARRVRPCVLYEMKRCAGPCGARCTREDYDKNLEMTIKFLRGQNREILDDLYAAMHKAADALEFEKAALIQKTITQIERTIEVQNVDKPLGIDGDAWGIFRQGNEVVVAQMLFREGKLLGVQSYNFTNIAQDDAELFESLLLQHYEKQEHAPSDIFLPVVLSGAEEISELLSTRYQKRVHVITPQRGEKKSWVEMASANAKSTFEKEKDIKTIREKTLLEMQELLHLQQYPRRIDCFDTSNIQGSDPVASMVVFTDGDKDSANYRLYKIKTTSGPDDYTAMFEVLSRRYKRAKDENNLPDLIVVDGGKGHLNVALKVMEELNIISVDVIGLAKEKGRHDKGITSEQVFVADASEPIMLKNTSSVLFLLQKIRDEAHRVAITFHRKRRSKGMVRSALDEIGGIGTKRRKVLLQHFGSLKKIKEATEDELSQVKGITKANVKAIISWREKERMRDEG